MQGETDELTQAAIEVIRETRRASTSSIQRRLRIGYTRASMIIDKLEADGLIGPADGANPRAVFIPEAPFDYRRPS